MIPGSSRFPSRCWIQRVQEPGSSPGQLIDTLTPKHGRTAVENDPILMAEPIWDPVEHAKSWRAVWAYSAKRAARDGKTLTAQENRATAIVEGRRRGKDPRFVTMKKGTAVLNEAAIARARRLAGLKGYVTNIPATLMPAAEVIASYHDLWHVEQSFRMSKTDLRARPIFHHDTDTIEAHLTIVMTALAVAHDLQQRTGLSIKKIVQTLRPLQEVTVRIAGHDHLAADPVTPAAVQILQALNIDTK